MATDKDKQIFKVQDWAQCLCSAVENLSAKTVYFPFPKHGTTLDAAEIFYFLGDLSTQLAAKRYKVQQSILNALKGGVLRLRQTPAAHWTYTATSTTVNKMIVTQDSSGTAVVATADPCWKP